MRRRQRHGTDTREPSVSTTPVRGVFPELLQSRSSGSEIPKPRTPGTPPDDIAAAGRCSSWSRARGTHLGRDARDKEGPREAVKRAGPTLPALDALSGRRRRAEPPRCV